MSMISVLCRKNCLWRTVISHTHSQRLCAATIYRLSAASKEVSSSSSQSRDDFMDRDKPVVFSTSAANKYQAYDTFFTKSVAPWYQKYCISGSLIVFLVYFAVLREENDMDEMLGESLWERIPQLKEQTLNQKIKVGRDAGVDVSNFEKELAELRRKFK